MKRNKKLVAVLSTAALLAMGASMTSFAAGWQKTDAGEWQYYDKDGEQVTNEWKKDQNKWFYLDEDGNMLKDSWVDDDYYVGEDGAMLVNEWKKTSPSDDTGDPDSGDDYWYYFNSKGKKVTDSKQKINGKTYYFDEDGKMKTGWQEDNGKAYYLGSEDEGWRAENQWLWLEASRENDDEDDEVRGTAVLGCSDNDSCDDEGWYWFKQSGEVQNDSGKKKINGKYYVFNSHGQMLYEWIDNDTKVTAGSNAQLDGNIGEASSADVGKMLYYNVVEDGSRGNGWYEIEGAEDTKTSGETDWYYVKDGKLKYADNGGNDFATYDEDGPVYVQRIKIDGKYFAFDEKGRMQTGLQYARADHGFYYFDDNGYMKTGKVSVECDDDTFTFGFSNKNGKSGQGYKGVKDNILYFNGKRLEANDSNALYYYNGNVYLVNTKGKIQKATSEKKFDIENAGIAADDVIVKTNASGVVDYITVDGTTYSAKDMLDDAIDTVQEADDPTVDAMVRVPSISLYDDIYTYTAVKETDDGYSVVGEGWLSLKNDDYAKYPMDVISDSNADASDNESGNEDSNINGDSDIR